jgi:hypothetical protein
MSEFALDTILCGGLRRNLSRGGSVFETRGILERSIARLHPVGGFPRPRMLSRCWVTTHNMRAGTVLNDKRMFPQS